jgi:hypothetical protein
MEESAHPPLPSVREEVDFYDARGVYEHGSKEQGRKRAAS